jgi:hypothetical protein
MTSRTWNCTPGRQGDNPAHSLRLGYGTVAAQRQYRGSTEAAQRQAQRQHRGSTEAVGCRTHAPLGDTRSSRSPGHGGKEDRGGSRWRGGPAHWRGGPDRIAGKEDRTAGEEDRTAGTGMTRMGRSGSATTAHPA